MTHKTISEKHFMIPKLHPKYQAKSDIKRARKFDKKSGRSSKALDDYISKYKRMMGEEDEEDEKSKNKKGEYATLPLAKGSKSGIKKMPLKRGESSPIKKLPYYRD